MEKPAPTPRPNRPLNCANPECNGVLVPVSDNSREVPVPPVGSLIVCGNCLCCNEVGLLVNKVLTADEINALDPETLRLINVETSILLRAFNSRN